MRAVDERDAYANLLMPRLLRERGIKGRDAALATELAYGTLRGLGTYDAIIEMCSDRAPDPAVRDALRLGAHQLLRMRVPPHAAVGTTVDLVRLRIGRGSGQVRQRRPAQDRFQDDRRVAADRGARRRPTTPRGIWP